MSDPKNECQRNFLEISPGTGVSKKGHWENSIWSKLGWFGMAGADECISFCGDSLIQCEEVETYKCSSGKADIEWSEDDSRENST